MNADDDLKQLKNKIRNEVIKKRDALSIQDRVSKSRMIFDKLISLPEYQNADNVLVYASMRSEVCTDEIIYDSLSLGKNVFCPKCLDKNNGIMKFIQIDRIEDLKEGYYGIREPEYNENSIIFDDLQNSSIVIVPGVAFDHNGNRIGYNGGYYDRFLKQYPNVYSVAISFGVQLISHIPVESHDVSVQKVLTE